MSGSIEYAVYSTISIGRCEASVILTGSIDIGSVLAGLMNFEKMLCKKINVVAI